MMLTMYDYIGVVYMSIYFSAFSFVTLLLLTVGTQHDNNIYLKIESLPKRNMYYYSGVNQAFGFSYVSLLDKGVAGKGICKLNLFCLTIPKLGLLRARFSQY